MNGLSVKVEHLTQSEKIADIDRQVSVKSQELDKTDDVKPEKRPLITMEIPMFLAMMSIQLNVATVNNLIMYRTCIHVKDFGDEVCSGFLAPDKTNVTQEVESEVQQYMNLILGVKTVLESLGPAFLCFFLGAWSDRHGRKPLVVWALFGLALSQSMIAVYSTLESLSPWWFIVTGIPNAILGYMILFTGAMCYMSDISTHENRSLRLTVVQIVLSMGQVTGQVGSSFLVQAIGITGLLSVSASSTSVAFLYTLFFIKESLNGATKGTIRGIFKFSLAKEMLRVVFKRRSNKGRAQIVLLILINTITIFIIYGMFSLEYSYVRLKLQWAMRDFTIFTAVATIIGCVGGFVGVVFIQKIFSVPDLAFIAFALFTGLVEFAVKAFATEGWHFYLSVCISVFSGLSGPLIRSILSKMILVTDVAKVFAFMGAVEGVSPLISPALYFIVYNKSIDVFPGAIYMMNLGFYVCCLVMVGFVQYFMRRAARATALDKENIQST
ncbi:major facilitator superfamily domain-containing protein [Phthorimaea operculella]|nr:major facilitator superfamily domain-containing protein [Phthorimaea operculella]